MTVPEEYVQSKSPFDGMKPLGAPVSVKESQVQSPTGRLQQQVRPPEFGILVSLISEDSQAAQTNKTH